MKKIVIALLGVLLIVPLIGVNIKNNKNYELETITNTYTKEEIDAKLNELKAGIDSNTSNIETNKNILTTIQNNLNNYALKSELNKANSNVDSLNSIVTSNTGKITNLENLFKEGDATASDIASGKTAIVQGELITGTMESVSGSWEIDVGKVQAYDSTTKTWYNANAPTGLMKVKLTINEDGTWKVSTGAGQVTAQKVS